MCSIKGCLDGLRELFPFENELVLQCAHYNKLWELMDFGNNKQVTIGNFPSFSSISENNGRHNIILTVFLSFGY